MPAGQDPGSLMLGILIIATMAVVCWRTVVKLVIIGIVVLAVLGLVELLGGLHLAM
jgi:hypothetical protein